MENKLRALIVDDEELARIDLRHMLKVHSSIEIVGEASSVQTAAKTIVELKPDIVFLDIEFPGESGFDLLDKIGEETKIVFITAFDEFAIRAFEVNACDYLLKPVSTKRLAQTVKRLETSSGELKHPESVYKYDDRIFVSVNYKHYFIRVSSIIRISSEGKYPEILTTSKVKGLVKKSLHDWEKCLPEKYFLRIHRSTIVNTDYIEKVVKDNSSYAVYLKSTDEKFYISRRYASQIRKHLTM